MIAYKEDWPEARERLEAGWQGEIVDRVAIQVTAPKTGYERQGNQDSGEGYGPDAIRHLDLLFDIPEIKAIQWVPIAHVSCQMEWISLHHTPSGSFRYQPDPVCFEEAQ